VADAKPEEIKELLGGALFKALYKWMVDTGPVYLLPTGALPFSVSVLLLKHLTVKWQSRRHRPCADTLLSDAGAWSCCRRGAPSF